MNIDFFAVRDDFRALFDFVWRETDCRIAESYSEYDQELRWFDFFEDLAAATRLGDDPRGSGMAASLVLWSPSVMPKYTIERITLDQRRTKGHQCRYSIVGAGLISLIAGGLHGNVITRSRMGHISEVRARAYGSDSGVDWPALLRLGRKIDYHVRKRMAAAKTTVGSLPILPVAFARVSDGAELRDAARASWKYEILGEPTAAN